MHNTLSRRFIAITLGAFAAAAMPALAQDHAGHGQPHMQHGAAAMPAMTDAEVRRIDKDAGKITLRHGEIKHLDMPPMTMVFTVRDKDQLTKLKPGDKVQFMAVQEGGKMIVTDIQPAR